MLKTMLVKAVGVENDKMIFEAHVRKDHKDDDLAEIARAQDRFLGKAQFKIYFDKSFSEKEALAWIKDFEDFNLFLNLYVRGDNYVRLNNTRFIIM